MLFQDQIQLSNETINGRRTVISRPINDCRTENAYFRSSHCTPEDSKYLGMQSWVISCHLPYNITDPLTTQSTTIWVAANRNGYCDEQETCVDTLELNAYDQMANMARCVSQEDYVFVNRTISTTSSYPTISLADKRANVMLSKSDGKTPLEVDTFDVKAGTVGTMGQRNRCRDCVDLRTDVFAPDTDILKTETRLLTAGAAAGILWLTFMSG